MRDTVDPERTNDEGGGPMRRVATLALLLLAWPGTAYAAPPANDNRADAEAIPAFPHTLTASTAEATVERLDPQVSRCGRVESTLWYRIDTAPDGLIGLTVKGSPGVAPVLRIYRRTPSAPADDADPQGCRLDGGTVWYRLSSRRDGRILLRLSAAGQLDAAILVLERVRSRTEGIVCAVTDRRGRATVGFASRKGATYLIAVGHVENADPGTFRIDTFLSEAAESPRAGKALPKAGVRSTVHGLTDVNDVWRVEMQPGITYRIGFSARSCATATLRARGQLRRVLATLGCRAYRTFTPGPDGGGAYVLEVTAAGQPQAQGYRLLFAPAAPDDLGVGVAVRNRAPIRGSLDPNRLDLQDVYHFDVERRGDVRVGVTNDLRYKQLTDSGRQLGSASSVRRQLDPGRYVVAVTASLGDPRTGYTLTLLIREITSTSLRLAATTVEPGSVVSIRTDVANASAGAVEIQIDRFDPLTGWHFNRLLRSRVGESVSWTPPAQGRWRLRAT